MTTTEKADHIARKCQEYGISLTYFVQLLDDFNMDAELYRELKRRTQKERPAGLPSRKAQTKDIS